MRAFYFYPLVFWLIIILTFYRVNSNEARRELSEPSIPTGEAETDEVRYVQKVGGGE